MPSHVFVKELETAYRQAVRASNGDPKVLLWVRVPGDGKVRCVRGVEALSTGVIRVTYVLAWTTGTSSLDGTDVGPIASYTFSVLPMTEMQMWVEPTFSP